LPLAFAALAVLAWTDHQLRAHYLVEVLFCLPILALAWRRHFVSAWVAATLAVLSIAYSGLEDGPFDVWRFVDRSAAAVLLFSGLAWIGARFRLAADRAGAAMYQSKEQSKNALTLFHECDERDPSWSVYDKGHEIGVPEVDHQHEELVGLVENLNKAINAGESSDALHKLFDELVLYTETHFATEERLMQIAGYPNFHAHKFAHAGLLSEVKHYGARLDRGGGMVALQSIKDWLVDHIETADKAMGAYLNRPGQSSDSHSES
jgi:hemerythrin